MDSLGFESNIERDDFIDFLGSTDQIPVGGSFNEAGVDDFSMLNDQMLLELSGLVNMAEESGTSGDTGGVEKKRRSSNTMSESRRRRKIIDRFHELKCVLPCIRKSDKASILDCAIAYVKELVCKKSELESITFNSRPKSPLSRPTVQPTTYQQVEVKVRQTEGKAMDIHMRCGHRPGLFLSALKAMHLLKFHIQHADMSFSNGVGICILRAEQAEGFQAMDPVQIKEFLEASLLDS